MDMLCRRKHAPEPCCCVLSLSPATPAELPRAHNSGEDRSNGYHILADILHFRYGLGSLPVGYTLLVVACTQHAKFKAKPKKLLIALGHANKVIPNELLQACWAYTAYPYVADSDMFSSGQLP